MHVCGQTLVLVDNDATVTQVSQKLVRATLKYIFYHMPEDRTFCLNTYERDICEAEEYSNEPNDLVCKTDNLEFSEKDSNIYDTLCEVVGRWKEADFACRDIVVFTDGTEGPSQNHEKEELYYLMQNSEYPVYIVMLDQGDNADARKGLSAVAVTSGGKLFETEFEGSDAGVDRQITEKLFAAMDEYSEVHWKKYEEEEEASAPEDESGYPEEGVSSDTLTGAGFEEGAAETYTADTETYTADTETYMEGAEYDEHVVYEYERPQGFFEGTGALVLSAVLIAVGIIAGILGGFVIMKKKRSARKRVAPVPPAEDELFDDYELKGMGTTDLIMPDENDTVFLGDDSGQGSVTRLLDTSCRMITLTEREGRGQTYRIALGPAMTIGRGNCDVKITGDDALSKRHCSVYEKDGEVYVKDMSSSNGTRVNSVRISEQKLSDRDELTIGSRTYIVGLT